MAMMSWEPFRGTSSLREMMDRFFEEGYTRPYESEGTFGMSFPIDVTERDDIYEVKASLPGLKPEDVDVTVSGNILTIRGERKEEHEEKRGAYLRRETRYGTFSRSFSFPTMLDTEHIDARFENGVLTLSVPKSPEERPKRIQVKEQRAVGSGGQTQQYQAGGQSQQYQTGGQSQQYQAGGQSQYTRESETGRQS